MLYWKLHWRLVNFLILQTPSADMIILLRAMTIILLQPVLAACCACRCTCMHALRDSDFFPVRNLLTLRCARGDSRSNIKHNAVPRYIYVYVPDDRGYKPPSRITMCLWVTDHQKVSLYFVENTDTDERKDRTKEDYVSFSQQLSTWRYSTDLTIGIFLAHSDILSSSSKLYEPLRLLFSVPKAVHLWCHYWTLSFLRCSMPPMMIDKYLFLPEAFILL